MSATTEFLIDAAADHAAHPLPPRLLGLTHLANNLAWSWNRDARTLFRQIDETLWGQLRHNPILLLKYVSAERLASLAADPAFCARYDRVMRWLSAEHSDEHTWYAKHVSRAARKADCVLLRGVRLSQLGADLLRWPRRARRRSLQDRIGPRRADRRHGHFLPQRLLRPARWSRWLAERQPGFVRPRVGAHSTGTRTRRRTSSDDREHLWPGCAHSRLAHAWWAACRCICSIRISRRTILDDRPLLSKLYSGGPALRLRQEWLLGVGGVRVLRALGIAPAAWHANEGHAGFMMLERVRELCAEGVAFDDAVRQVRASSVFTTHTPVPAGHDQFAS